MKIETYLFPIAYLSLNFALLAFSILMAFYSSERFYVFASGILFLLCIENIIILFKGVKNAKN